MENTLELNLRAKPITNYIQPASGVEAKEAMENGIVVVLNPYHDPGTPEFEFKVLNPIEYANAPWLEKQKHWIRIDPSRIYVFSRAALIESPFGINGKRLFLVVGTLQEVKEFEHHERFIKWEEQTIRHYVVEKGTSIY